MFLSPQRIAFITVETDPAAQFPRAMADQRLCVKQWAQILARYGWQVDLFTRQNEVGQSAIVQHHPNCRTIRLPCGPVEPIHPHDLFQHLPEFVQVLQSFQSWQDGHYSLVHTYDWLSGWVGLKLKRHNPLLHMHTFHSFGTVEYLAIDELPEIAPLRTGIEQRCLESADCVIATSHEQYEQLHAHATNQRQIGLLPNLPVSGTLASRQMFELELVEIYRTLQQQMAPGNSSQTAA